MNPKPDLALIVKSIANNLVTKFNNTTTVIISALLIILINLGIALPGLAQNNSFYWDFLNINLDVQDNGDLLVTESQKYVFTSSHSPQRYFLSLNKLDTSPGLNKKIDHVASGNIFGYLILGFILIIFVASVIGVKF